MTAVPTNITVCPPELRAAALDSVLRTLPKQQRKSCLDLYAQTDQPGLFLALQANKIVAACWVQPQPGNCAVFWPPQGDAKFADMLVARAAEYLDGEQCGLAQVSLTASRDSVVPLIERHGFHRLAELHYLSSQTFDHSFLGKSIPGLEYEPFQTAQMPRLMKVIEQTYCETLDCPSLNGVRRMEEVMEGYLATGSFDPSLWSFVRRADVDIGVLLLTSHPELESCELVYMGLIPTERGRSYGINIVRQAQKVAHEQGASQLVVAVDSANIPAANIYLQAGFTAWDRRIVYVRSLHPAVQTSAIEAA